MPPSIGTAMGRTMCPPPACFEPQMAYTGPNWIGEAIGQQSWMLGPHWIGLRITPPMSAWSPHQAPLQIPPENA